MGKQLANAFILKWRDQMKGAPGRTLTHRIERDVENQSITTKMGLR